MAHKNPGYTPRGRPHKIILRSEIEEAQRHTNSNHAAARWLNVSYLSYKKYAKLYDLFDRHLNKDGIGIAKGFAKRPTSIPLRDILAGKYPKYSLAKLRNRLIARKKLVEECTCCGFKERRITDGKVPLMLTFADGDHTNFTLSNLQLYCYNCMFLTTGAPWVVNRQQIETSFRSPEKLPAAHTQSIIQTDAYDLDAEAELLHTTELMLTEEEKAALYNSD